LYEASGIMLTLLLISFGATKGTRRTPVLVSMAVSWLLAAFPSSMILYITNTITGPPPSFSVCLTSSALIMAQTPLNATCAICLVYHIWKLLQDSSTKLSGGSTRIYLLVILPYVIFIISIVAVVVVGLLDPASVSRKTFYCVVDKTGLTIFLGVYSAICCIAAFVLEVLIAIKLRRNRHEVIASGMDVSLVIRVVAFGITILWGLVLACLAIQDWYSVIPDLCFATFGIIFFFIFASQADIINLWRHWAVAMISSTSSKFDRSSDQIVLTTRESKP